MAFLQHLQRRGGTFRFRVRIPNDLRPLLDRNEISRTLGTSDFAEAKRRLPFAWAAWERTAQAIRTTPNMDKAAIDALVKDFVATELDAHRALTEAAQRVPTLQDRLDRENEHRAHLRELITSDIAKDRLLWTQAHLEEFLERRGIPFDRENPLYFELLRSLGFGWLDAIDKMAEARPDDPQVDRSVAHITHKTTEARLDDRQDRRSKPKSPTRSPKPIHTIGKLIDDFLREKERSGIGASWAVELKRACAWFREWFGDDHDITKITRADMVEFKNGLLELPVRWSQKLRGMTIRQAAEHNRTAGLPKLNVAAVKGKSWQPVAEFLEWAHGSGYIPDNPAKGIPIPVSKSAKQKRDGFTTDDLSKMFNAPLFTGAASSDRWWEPGPVRIRDHRFWLLLLATFTGARRGELCQLLLVDVVERDSVLCLNITDDEPGQSIKNEDSKRLVPVHPELLRIGFAQYVEQRRKAGHDCLFDVPSGDQFGKWFARFTDKLEIDSSRKVFHSFRHGFETAMRDCINDFDLRSRISGREHGHSSAIYGKSHSPKKLFEEISKVNYPGLNLTHLVTD